MHEISQCGENWYLTQDCVCLQGTEKGRDRRQCEVGRRGEGKK